MAISKFYFEKKEKSWDTITRKITRDRRETINSIFSRPIYSTLPRITFSFTTLMYGENPSLLGENMPVVQKCTCPRYRCELKLKLRRDGNRGDGAKGRRERRRKRGKIRSRGSSTRDHWSSILSRQRGYSLGVIKRNEKKSRPKSRPRNTTPITRRITELVNDRFNVCDAIRGRGIVTSPPTTAPPPPSLFSGAAGGQELIKNPISRWIVYFKSGNDFHRANKLKSTRGNRLVVLVGTTLRDGEEESFVRDQTAE